MHYVGPQFPQQALEIGITSPNAISGRGFPSHPLVQIADSNKVGARDRLDSGHVIGADSPAAN
jgi:hypothetical protein